MARSLLVLIATCCLVGIVVCKDPEEKRLALFTVATEANDGFLRFAKSAKKYGYKDVNVLGMGKKWEGGDIARFPGGGQKVIFFKEALEKVKDQEDLVVMFTDSYDVIFTEGPQEVLKRFEQFDAQVVFSAEGYCWPDESLAAQYPEVTESEKRFLNSGGIIGYAPQVYKVLTRSTIQNTDDDQLYYTNIYLDNLVQKNFTMKLDTKSEIFQNMNGALEDIQLEFKDNKSRLVNTLTGMLPVVVHGNGPITHYLNSYANYLMDSWTPDKGCQICNDDTISLTGISPEDLPTVYMAIFIDQAIPFIEDFFSRVGALNYPKSRINLFIYYGDDYVEQYMRAFVDKFGLEYNKVEVQYPGEKFTTATVRNRALEGCLEVECQYFFYLEGDVQLESEDLLLELIQRNRSAIAPLVVRPEKMWSNFWGLLSNDGFYKRSNDYLDIIERKFLGVWNVPYITGSYLIHGYLVPKLVGGYLDQGLDPDMAICKRMRDNYIFMYVDNLEYFGHLVNAESFENLHKHNDLYELFTNKYTWEKKYLHKDYHDNLLPDHKYEEPCPDVFWMPVATDTFCQHLIDECEHKGEWSSGKNADPRLAGGYENVPTVDTHMNQIGFEKHWLQILTDYIAPITSKAFMGYFSDSRAIMNFVVRYKPTEQDRLRPHSDSSTFTVNMALNRVGIDYEGGGVRFLRYNCTNTDLRRGWAMLHPGRLTHHHEGLQTTAGTRYIMISFVDP